MVLDRYGVFHWAVWRNVTSPFACVSVVELLMSVLLLQQLRTIERRMGSSKYAVRVANVCVQGQCQAIFERGRLTLTPRVFPGFVM